jgi:hypothetical protein
MTTKRTPADSPNLKLANQFPILLMESRKFCKGMGLSEDLIMDLYKTESDWTFTLKVDAHE